MKIAMPSTRTAPALQASIVAQAFALVCAMACPLAVLAGEGGQTHYLPGAAATLIDVPPSKPGWVVEPVYLHYDGSASASRNIAVGGLVAAGLDATSDALLLGGFYTFEQTVWGAYYSIGAYVPYVWISATADVSASNLGERQRRDRASGIGDVTLIPAMLAWKSGDWQYSAFLPIAAPTGDYQTGRLANPGLNYWTFDPTAVISYNNAKTGLNAALFAGVSLNTENSATNYRSGTEVHFDGSVQQLLPAGPGFLGIGAEAFYVQQVTGDSGVGATLGSFKGHTAGIGPVLTYILPVGKEILVAELRWLPELDVKKRLDGDYVWLKAAYQF